MGFLLLVIRIHYPFQFSKISKLIFFKAKPTISSPVSPISLDNTFIHGDTI